MSDYFVLTTAGGSVLCKAHDLVVIARHVQLANNKRYPTFIAAHPSHHRERMYELVRTENGWRAEGSPSALDPWCDTLVRQLNDSLAPTSDTGVIHDHG